jgi:hypothetical protein
VSLRLAFNEQLLIKHIAPETFQRETLLFREHLWLLIEPLISRVAVWKQFNLNNWFAKMCHKKWRGIDTLGKEL